MHITEYENYGGYDRSSRLIRESDVCYSPRCHLVVDLTQRVSSTRKHTMKCFPTFHRGQHSWTRSLLSYHPRLPGRKGVYLNCAAISCCQENCWNGRAPGIILISSLDHWLLLIIVLNNQAKRYWSSKEAHHARRSVVLAGWEVAYGPPSVAVSVRAS